MHENLLTRSCYTHVKKKKSKCGVFFLLLLNIGSRCDKAITVKAGSWSARGFLMDILDITNAKYCICQQH